MEEFDISTKQKLNDTLNNNYFLNIKKDNSIQELNNNIFYFDNNNDNDNSLLSQNMVDSYFNSNQIMIKITKDFNGTLDELLRDQNIRLKEGIKKLAIDIFLVGGGSSGSCMIEKNNGDGCPVTGDILYKKNILIDLDMNIKITIGKGGDAIPEKWLEKIANTYMNNGTDTIFSYNNHDYIAKGGKKIFDEDNKTIIEYSGSYGNNPYRNKTYYYTNSKNEIRYVGGDSEEEYTLSDGGIILGSKDQSLSSKYLPHLFYIPNTSEKICSNGIYYYIQDNGEDHFVRVQSTGFRSYYVFPEYIYDYFIADKGECSSFKSLSYRDADDDIFRLYVLEGADSMTYGGSGSCGSIAPYNTDYLSEQTYRDILKNAYPNFSTYKYYRGRCGAGGPGVCCIYIGGEYCE